VGFNMQWNQPFEAETEIDPGADDSEFDRENELIPLIKRRQAAAEGRLAPRIGRALHSPPQGHTARGKHPS
jgi:hypothetical protein